MVSTPPSSHAGIYVAALGNGKDVLCEKPPRDVKAREGLDAGVIGVEEALQPERST